MAQNLRIGFMAVLSLTPHALKSGVQWDHFEALPAGQWHL